MSKRAGGTHAAIEDFPEVKLKLADGTLYQHPGKVVKMSGVINQATGAVSLIARFPNPEHLLKSGASGTIIVPRVSNNSLVIPQSATTEIQDKVFVYKLGPKNQVRYTEITVDPQNDGNNYVVTGGLKAGDKIVTRGLTTLKDSLEIVPLTEEQYLKKVSDAAKMGKNQSSVDGFMNMMKK